MTQVFEKRLNSVGNDLDMWEMAVGNFSNMLGNDLII